MIHNTKKLLIAALLFVICLAFVSCGGIDSIYFENEPRTLYVQGQDLVLDGAVINALKGDKSEPIDLSEVQISGYDKNKLGTQEVTFTYEEFSITLTVEVIPRISVEGAATNYFLGDSFDKTKGRIKVADDDGKTQTVMMSDSSVTVEGFDSSAAGVGKTVTVRYGDYSGSLKVNVYDAQTVELSSRPKKTSYYSHDTDFSTVGAYFTVTAGDGAINRMVELTADMVSGFDPLAATIDNLDSPLKQTVTISYLGRNYPFEISIRYSGISLMRMRGEELKDVDPKGATKEQGEAALFAIEKYLDLSPAEQNQIDEQTVTKLLEVAVIHGASEFDKAKESFSDAFGIHPYYDEESKRYIANFSISAASYEIASAALLRLKDGSEPLFDLASTLRAIKDEFHSTKIDGKSVDELLGSVYDEESLEQLISILELMIELHEILSVIPNDWTAQSLKDYKDTVVSAVVRASSNDFGAFSGNDAIYSLVSSWRENDDYFDIIYAYYLEYEKDSLIETLWQKVCLPGKLQALYTMISYSIGSTQSMKVGYDTTAFMYYYDEAIKIAKEITEGDNQLHIDIYKHINFDALITNYLFIGTAEGINNIAYVYHVSSLLDNETYDALLEKYLLLLDSSLREDFSYGDEEAMTLASEILSLYMEFTPAERFAFLCSLHCDYRYSVTDDLVLGYEITDDGEISGYSYFIRLLLSVFRENLTEGAFDVFARLLEASEMHVLKNHNPKHYDGFVDKDGVSRKGFIEAMEQIISDAKALSEKEKESFAVALDKLTEIYEQEKSPLIPELDESAKSSFEELLRAIEVFFEIYSYADSEEVPSAQKGRYFIIAFAAYERARAIADELIESENDAILKTYLYIPYEFDTHFEAEDGTTTVNRTFDFMLDEISGIFHMITLRMEAATGPEDDLSIYNAFYVYYVSGMNVFLEDVYDIMLAEYRGTSSALPVADVLESLAAYRALEEDPIFGMYLLGASSVYFDAVIKCLEASFDEATMNVVLALMYAQESYASYIVELKDDEAKRVFSDAIDALKTAYDALPDRSEFDKSFLEMYEFYVELLDDISEDGSETEE